MKRRKLNFEASTPEVSPASLPLSRNNEEMIFPSHNRLSRRIFPALNDQIGAFTWGQSDGATALSPRSSIASGDI